MTANQIIWTQLQGESANERTTRLNAELHRIFFESKDVCPDSFLDTITSPVGVMCRMCNANTVHGYVPRHGVPRFLESLDAMQLIVTSGRFAEVREEFFHWLVSEGKPPYECTILLYGKQHDRTRFVEKGYNRQEAFYLAALKSQGYDVVQEEQGTNNEHQIPTR